MTATHDKPLACTPFTSYRLRGPYGFIMIGATDDAGAMRQAAASTDNPQRDALEVWSGEQYVPALPAFVVARVWNRHGPQDYLMGWDERWGTACAGKPLALRFATQVAAEEAAVRAAQLVPCLIGGAPITYTVLPA